MTRAHHVVLWVVTPVMLAVVGCAWLVASGLGWVAAGVGLGVATLGGYLVWARLRKAAGLPARPRATRQGGQRRILARSPGRRAPRSGRRMAMPGLPRLRGKSPNPAARRPNPLRSLRRRTAVPSSRLPGARSRLFPRRRGSGLDSASRKGSRRSGALSRRHAQSAGPPRSGRRLARARQRMATPFRRHRSRPATPSPVATGSHKSRASRPARAARRVGRVIARPFRRPGRVKSQSQAPAPQVATPAPPATPAAAPRPAWSFDLARRVTALEQTVARSGHTDGRTGVTAMSSAQHVAEAIHEGMGSWEPGHAVEVDRQLEALPLILESLSRGLGVWADKVAEGPFDPSVADDIRELAANVMSQTEAAAGIRMRLRAAHEAEFRRLEEPRPGEVKWDVSTAE